MLRQSACSLLVLGCLALTGARAGAARSADETPSRPGQAGPVQGAWKDSFKINAADLATTGRNDFFILEPGYQLTLEGRENGKPVRLVVSVLDETKTVAGFDTRIVEERETKAGTLVEVSRNYFAIHRMTGDVYYFGEDVDVYRNGKVSGHEGAWLHGEGGAGFGLMMAGKPSVGLRYYQELAPNVAMDRAEVVSLAESLSTPAGTFDRCLKVRETTPLEPGAREFKIYAPGVGLVQDGSLVLTGIRRTASGGIGDFNARRKDAWRCTRS